MSSERKVSNPYLVWCGDTKNRGCLKGKKNGQPSRLCIRVPAEKISLRKKNKIIICKIKQTNTYMCHTNGMAITFAWRCQEQFSFRILPLLGLKVVTHYWKMVNGS
jgi:hypothetical protein